MNPDLEHTKIFIKPGATDLRKAVNGLSILIQEEMYEQPLSGSLFMFCNKSRKLIKVIWWDKTGFWLCQKKLEKALHKIATLEKDNKSLEKKVFNAEKKNNFLENEIVALKEKFALALFRRFGPTAEKFFPGQPELFDKEEETTEVKSHTRTKKGRKPISKNIPRKEIIIDIAESEKKCACGSELVKIGEERSERLQVIPAKIYVEVTVRPKYACRTCEGSGDEDKPVFRCAPTPPSLLPGSITSPGLLAFIFINKFCDHLPYYRQEKAWERQDIFISRQNMSNWQLQVYEKLKILEGLMKEHLKKGPFIQMDETTARVFKESERRDDQKSYMWLARGGPVDKPVVLYQYYETRASIHVHDFISGYSGFLQTDGYQGYKTALEKHKKTHPHDEITHVGCFAHARRKFYEASVISKKSKSPEVALSFIRKLYKAESRLKEKNLTEEQFLEEREMGASLCLQKMSTINSR